MPERPCMHTGCTKQSEESPMGNEPPFDWPDDDTPVPHYERLRDNPAAEARFLAARDEIRAHQRNEPPFDSEDKEAWIAASPFYVRCVDPNCPTLRGADPPLRHYHYVGDRD